MRVVFCLIAIFTVSALFAASGAAAKSSPSCKNLTTYQQAVQAGEMPAIVSALHGGAPIQLTCSN
jgi:hypothetical protein